MTNAYVSRGGEERRQRSGERDRKEGSASRLGDSEQGECYLDSVSLQAAFRDFQSRVPLKKLVSTQNAHHIWQWYELCGTDLDSEASPLISSSPIIFLHGVNGTAAIYFQQLEALAEKGYRVLSVQWPALSSLASFLSSFDEFLTHVLATPAASRVPRSRRRLVSSAAARGDGDAGEGRVRRGAHLFGAGLGGVLCLYFAQRRPEAVASVVLCNAFLNSAFLLGALAPLQGVLAPMYHLLPHAALRKIVIDTYLTPKAAAEAVFVPPSGVCTGARGRRDESPENVWAPSQGEADSHSQGVWVVPQEDLQIRNSKEFLVSHLDELSAKELAARLALQVAISAATPLQKTPERVLILQSLDADVPPDVAEDLRNFFPRAKVAELRDGGQFPFLSRPEEVTLHMQVHLRNCGLFPDLHLIERQVSGEETSCSLANTFAASGRSSFSLSESHTDHPVSFPSYPHSCSRSPGSPASRSHSSAHGHSSFSSDSSCFSSERALSSSYSRSASSCYNSARNHSSLAGGSSADNAFYNSSSFDRGSHRGAAGCFVPASSPATSQATASDGAASSRGISTNSGERWEEREREKTSKFADADLAAQERWNRKHWKNPFKEAD
ncbi:hydrolase alpha/beta fold protein [Toxoplasma gondii MAS]|uniref:Maspardin n=1 Tax=Toxoplasma gondii MAS TaxID=943118 RepID=A0A086QZ34_TOXGO|nr:hydrolase alpha/beta fold protein [Toxoplasma gondii MAS]